MSEERKPRIKLPKALVSEGKERAKQLGISFEELLERAITKLLISYNFLRQKRREKP